MFDGAKPSTAAAGLGGSHNDSCHRRNSMSALRIWKADLSGCLATALVAVLSASSGIVYAQVLKKPAASAPPARSAAAPAAHTAAPAASHPAAVHPAAPTNTGNRGAVSSPAGRGPVPSGNTGRGPVPNYSAVRGLVPNNNAGRSFGTNNNAGRGPVPN